MENKIGRCYPALSISNINLYSDNMKNIMDIILGSLSMQLTNL